MPQTNLFTLIGTNSQLILELGEYAEILHWGQPVSGDLESYRQSLYRPVPYGRLDKDVALTLHPELGRGLFSSPALEGDRQGQDWAPVFSIENMLQGDNSILIDSVDEQAGLRLYAELRLDSNDVLMMRQTLTNTKPEQYHVHRFANTLPLPARTKELMTYYGRWVHEFQTQRQPISHGGYQQENRRGRTSHEHYPALVAGTNHFDELHGEVWGFHFAWSGNHRMRVDVKTDGRRQLQAEALYLPGEIVLQQEQSITTPWLYASYSDTGLNGMSQQFHSHVRQSILAPEISSKPRPIHLNTWEGIYFDHDPDYILSMASQAADMGVERFIIDDGWFKKRNGDNAALGDWFLDQDKYPNGLEPIIEHVNQLGMEFGLWFEPEMINPDSDLFRQHPEWVLGVEGYDQPKGRNQYAIDLQNQDAFDYLLERLDHFLSQYNIAYIKWDMNREIVQPAHNGQAAGYGQVKRYYALVDKVRSKHPNVEIESCAAGGGRIDFEVLKRTHRFWASDNNDALERQTIQKGMSYFFPSEVMGSHIGASHCHSTRRKHTINFRGITALFGHMGLELDPVKESDQEKQGFERYVELHKSLRPLLHSGTSWRLPTDDDAQQALAVVAKDKSQAVVMIAQLAMPIYATSGHLRIAGLDPNSEYRVSVLDKPQDLDSIVATQPQWVSEDNCVLSGEWCEKVGLTMPILDSESAVLLRLDKVK
ncbi:alpha-galactosidase [Vibrio sp. SCSIO 43136]|uniref:alpha-galactosidase n=1 Tax=Vibrio sp. SCSIO 43136 TaxID=2819101 RepID=UPI00207603A3|nr:alpha-galactosidase [Vibrio sp. SCSIO 43136]USD66105.1 alpha-galactosidase [Vibrio sp. SCSIO 43136]